ncbi:SHD1 domain-containing protein [Rhodopirellula sp. JC639]|uniref:SHD1 domain-containing protein n=1 Tax=Stieleria mannarensis TaxID=2755585 RepID=UPI001600D6DA|nr:SHD1 domain-containing protein [Rhodopirellula sp. JC639]
MRIPAIDERMARIRHLHFRAAKHCVIASITLFLVAAAQANAQDPSTRVWRDVTGKFSVTAELLGSDNGEVKLRLKDGKDISVPIERLSAQDRAFLAGRTPRTKRTPVATGIALAKTITGAPLPSAEIGLTELQQLLPIPVFLDIRAMESIGFGTETQVNLAKGHASLQDQLDDALNGLDLSWCTTQTALVLTSKEALERRFADTRFYRIPTPRGRGGAGPLFDRDAVIQQLSQRVSPQSWEHLGGRGTVNAIPYLVDKYVITQSPDVHRQLVKTLKIKSMPHVFKHRLDLTAVTVSMETAPITEILDSISQQINVPIEPSAKLSQVGLDLSKTRYKSSIHLESVSAKDALDLLLSQVDCTWVEDGKKLIVMDSNEAEKTLSSKRFAVKLPVPETSSFIHLLTESVAADSWEAFGGPGTIMPTRGRAGLLEIKQGQPAMREVEQFMLELNAIH